MKKNKKQLISVIMSGVLLLSHLLPSIPVMAERPYENPDYLSDLSCYTHHGKGMDFVDYYTISGNQLTFDSSEGPYVTIDYMTGDIIDCSTGTAELRSLEVDENAIHVTIYSVGVGRNQPPRVA